MTKPKSNKHLRTEKAMRAAARALIAGDAHVSLINREEPYEIVVRGRDLAIFAIFDLRDCYRKRKPMKGIGKKVAKLVRTGR